MKVIGVGLNKTGTKTLAYYLKQWGLRHRTYDLPSFHLYRDGEIAKLLDQMADWDSFEDWPWPLIYREIDERYPDARFVLTVRESPAIWYRSLCRMAVRLGPLDDFEQHIYGHAMPQGHRDEHFALLSRAQPGGRGALSRATRQAPHHLLEGARRARSGWRLSSTVSCRNRHLLT